MRDSTPDGGRLSLNQLLGQWYQRLLHETSTSKATFCANLREHHERLVPPAARSIEWSSHPDAATRMLRDAEKVSRWFDDDVQARFPLEAYEAFVLSFPPDRRMALQQSIAARSMLLVWPMPMGGTTEDCAELARLCQEAGDAIHVVSGLLDDGRIDHLDRHAAPAAILEIDEAMAALIAMRERIERQALGRRATDCSAETERSVRVVK